MFLRHDRYDLRVFGSAENKVHESACLNEDLILGQGKIRSCVIIGVLMLNV
jgi:hypothetical protein